MNRIIPWGFIYLLLGTATLFATAFDEANREYQSGKFKEAAAGYEKVLLNEGPQAAVFYNLGNSYQSLKQYGLAILAYERARLLTPRDPDLIVNLALARKAAASLEEPKINPRLEAVLMYFSRDEWSWLVAGAALFLGSVILVVGLVGLPRRIFKITASCAGFAVVLVITGAIALYFRRSESSKGIVVFENATFRLSPFEKAESLGTAGQGKVVYLGVKSGDFQYIKISGTNLQGWLANKDVAAIVQE